LEEPHLAKGNKMSVIDTGMQAFLNVGSAITSGLAGSSSSLIEFTKPTQVEPIVVIDNGVIFNENLTDVMQSLLSQFSGYYLQAAALLTNIEKVSVLRTLERLNPDRNGDVLGRIWSGVSTVSVEDYKNRLPRYDRKVSIEADVSVISAIGKDSITQLRTLENLSVGKIITVTVTGPDRVTTDKDKQGNDRSNRQSGTTIDIPVAIRLQATQLDAHQIVHMLSQGNQDLSAEERRDGFLAGRLRFWKDIVFCIDIMDSHRRALIKDKDGVISEIARRNRNNTVASVVTNRPSLATASNMVVMSDSTAAQLENVIKGRLSDFRTRQKIFDVTSLMIIVVMDPNLNRIRFYYRGIELSSDYSPRDLKGSNKGSGPDIMDILKAYQVAQAPSL